MNTIVSASPPKRSSISHIRALGVRASIATLVAAAVLLVSASPALADAWVAKPMHYIATSAMQGVSLIAYSLDIPSSTFLFATAGFIGALVIAITGTALTAKRFS